LALAGSIAPAEYRMPVDVVIDMQGRGAVERAISSDDVVAARNVKKNHCGFVLAEIWPFFLPSLAYPIRFLAIEVA
jgi:hypothetical protein